MKLKAKKLTLSRETLTQLEFDDLSRVAGGDKFTQPVITCPCPTQGCSGSPVCGDW